jgi:hypothetical protein
MTSQHTGSQSGKTIVSAAIAGLVFAVLFCKLDGIATPGCHLLGKTVWAAVEVLRLGVMFARWYGVAAYLYESSRLAQHLVQVGACIWPLVGAIAG